MPNYWFKAHKYGYGWSPATWQGWLTITLYITALVYSFVIVEKQTHSVSDTFIDFLPRVLFFSAVLICITYFKGEPVRWRWGNKNTTSDSKDK